MGLLHVPFGIFLDVLAQAVLDEFLKLFNRIAAGVTDGHLRLLEFTFALLAEVATTLFGERRKDEADGLTVVGRRESDVRVDDSALDLVDEFLLPRRDGDGACIGGGDGRAVSER